MLKDFEAIEQEVVDIITVIRGIEFDFESIAKIGQLIAKPTVLYDSFNKVVGPCQEYAKEMQDVILRVKEHVESVSYLTSLPVHLLMEMSNLKTLLSKPLKILMIVNARLLVRVMEISCILFCFGILNKY
jgi:hypothetical protein